MKKTEKIIISVLAVICIALALLFYQNSLLDSKIYFMLDTINYLEYKIEEAETATEELKREFRKYK